MTVPRISVVVPFFNSEDLLGDCLKSIAAQTFTDLEVIMVDDGSTDGSAAIAAAQAAADPRFTLLQVPNGGPGYARNRGIERARGTYLAFVDSDDTLPAHAYARLLPVLEKSGSDFVSGNVQRTGPLGITQSALHAKAIKAPRTGTHISRTPALFYDVSVWNKLFRKSFWDMHGLTFPEGIVWEDLHLITRAHVLARAVDIITDPIYFWRERGAGALSITQSRTEVSNYTDRISVLLFIDAFLRSHKPASMVREHQRKALDNDVWLYVGELGRTSQRFNAEFMRLTRAYLAQVDKRVFRRLPSPHRLAYYLILRNRLDELLEFVMWSTDQPIKTVPVVREHGRLRADLPFRRDADMPDRLYKPHWRELSPFVRVEGLDWQGDRLVMSGCMFVPSVDIPRRRNASKIVVLVPRRRCRLPVVVPARSTPHPDAMTLSGQDRYAYDWAGFRCEINPRLLRTGGRWRPAEWDAFVLVRGRNVWRPSRLHSPAAGAAERPAPRQVAPGFRVGAYWAGLQLRVQVESTPAVLSGSQRDGENLVLEVDVTPPANQVEGGDLLLRWPRGGAERRVTASRQRLDATTVRLRATVSLDSLLAAPSAWDLYVTGPGDQRIRVAFPADRPEYQQRAGGREPHGELGREIVVERTRYGHAAIAVRGEVPVIDDHSWTADGRLILSGRFAGLGGEPFEAVLSRKTSTERHVAPMIRDGERFTITIDAASMPSFGRRLPLRDGTWLLAVRRAGRGDELITPAYEHGRLAGLRERRLTFGPKSYCFTTTGYDSPILIVAPALRLTEHGRIQRKVLRSVYYPVQQRLGLRDAVLFISWKGKQCSDNPRGIAEELRRRGDSREHIWVVNDWAIPVPDGATAVLAGTEDYYEAVARSRYLISNDDMQDWYVKREGQVYVQTWHGTPLKRIGFDVAHPQFISGTRYLDHLAQDVAKWDLLLSPNPFSTPILRRAFHFPGEIAETGYPRNDVLCGADAGQVAARVRAALGIPAGKRVIMYAPTWRDNQYYASGRYRFDFRLDLEQAYQRLGQDHVILLRGHHQMADDVPAGTRPGFVINVTDYPDIAELFLATDAVITDYSSVMFDFAPTGRPILFFTYDLEEYRDELRGFYFDLQAEAPGPLLATSAEVVEAIASLDTVAADYRQAYQRFAARFCPLDDGKAAARACDRIFGG
ncbi:MAG TPA: bifunctional glycosyltransferase family 2 protein/CDP-glycerol:glycerophosphate glycerophosphotransferase [Streptosporangiaceae bacterium]|nr:bifunctional glycosyltransferase family 2 protein/CDP-glycerol:glycerophosphate glycerophosphotransferase [Streptosporangiaceae bacterium]